MILSARPVVLSLRIRPIKRMNVTYSPMILKKQVIYVSHKATNYQDMKGIKAKSLYKHLWKAMTTLIFHLRLNLINCENNIICDWINWGFRIVSCQIPFLFCCTYKLEDQWSRDSCARVSSSAVSEFLLNKHKFCM